MLSPSNVIAYAALDTKTGKVQGKTTARPTSADFIALLSDLVAHCPAEIHILLDNLAAHKNKLLNDFLFAHPSLRLHFTPTYSSWLNQVEIWLAGIERDVIARGVFSSVADLARKLSRYISVYFAHAKPFKWKYYSDPLITSVTFSMRQGTSGNALRPRRF